MSWALLVAGLLAIGNVGLLIRYGRQRAALRAQRAAAEQQARVRAALEAQVQSVGAAVAGSSDGYFVLDENQAFVEVNPAFCRMTGYTADELRAMTMNDLELPGGAPEGGATSEDGHVLTAHRHKAGHMILLETAVSVVRLNGQTRLVGLARDATARTRANHALRESEARYRNLVEMSRDLIWSLDLEGRWTFVNSAARMIYGCEPQELLGRPLMAQVLPERRPQTQQMLDELRAGKPRLRLESTHLRRDGTVVQLSINAIPVRDEYGNVVGSTGTSTDITERKRAEERVREANARFESLVAGMPLGYIVWTPDFRVLEWNPAAAAIFGYTAEEAAGRTASELLVPPEEQGRFDEMAGLLRSGHGGGGMVLVNRRAGGEKIRCEWVNTVLSGGGGVQAIVTLVRDVSERERLEAQLRQSQKLESLGVLAGGVAHDFNNLLVGILGNASLALEQLAPDSALRPLLERVVNAGRRATDLTQRMLAYAGRATCDVQLMDLNTLVSEMADFAAAGVPKRVALHIHTAADLPLVKADGGQMQQVIMNLLINAAEAIGESGGEVTVSTWHETLEAERIAAEFPDRRLAPGEYVCLEVRDTGSGMTPEVQARIFDPFFTTKFAGRGLGLSAILGIVQAHRGAVTVSSQVGVGTVFRVYLPVAAPRTTPVPVERVTPPLPPESTILVIDDEEDIREVVQAVLESRGLRVLTAEDGQRGIEVFREHAARINAVLLDLNMPGMSGVAVFRALLELRPDVKVILSTGFSEQEAARQFANAPLAGFVHKPYTATALVEKIGAALGVN